LVHREQPTVFTSNGAEFTPDIPAVSPRSPQKYHGKQWVDALSNLDTVLLSVAQPDCGMSVPSYASFQTIQCIGVEVYRNRTEWRTIGRGPSEGLSEQDLIRVGAESLTSLAYRLEHTTGYERWEIN
jgi:hypothetical protein